MIYCICFNHPFLFVLFWHLRDISKHYTTDTYHYDVSVLHYPRNIRISSKNDQWIIHISASASFSKQLANTLSIIIFWYRCSKIWQFLSHSKINNGNCSQFHVANLILCSNIYDITSMSHVVLNLNSLHDVWLPFARFMLVMKVWHVPKKFFPELPLT